MRLAVLVRVVFQKLVKSKNADPHQLGYLFFGQAFIDKFKDVLFFSVQNMFFVPAAELSS